jgi:hypothetical protein
MSTVTISLTSPRYAPWGLLTDEEHPQTLCWLTEMHPTAHLDSEILTDWDVKRIEHSCLSGVVTVDGLDFPGDPRKPASHIMTVPVGNSVQSKVQPSETIMDVTALMRQEAQRAEAIKERIVNRYPVLDEVLELPANQLKKKLKEMAKDPNCLPTFFQEARKREMIGKDRKTVITLLVEIIQSKIAAQSVDGRANRGTGQTVLSDMYYDMIEEFEDEDEE